MKKIIGIVGSIITLILAFLWWNDIISEPFFAIGSAGVALIVLILMPNSNTDSTGDITQKHSGTGDNVAGNKTTNYCDGK